MILFLEMQVYFPFNLRFFFSLLLNLCFLIQIHGVSKTPRNFSVFSAAFQCTGNLCQVPASLVHPRSEAYDLLITQLWFLHCH